MLGCRRYVSILRCADEHFDEIVVQGVVKLALQMPGKLRVVEIAGMDRKHVGMRGRDCVFQVDENFDNAIVLAPGESEEGMIVEAQVIEDLGELERVGHGIILLGELQLVGSLLVFTTWYILPSLSGL